MKRVAVISVVCVVTVAVIFIAAFGGLNFLISVPKPEIEYSEFPFTLTYEINGEIKTVSDTIICKFDGFKVIGEAGKYRKWKSYLKSGNDEITILDLRGKNDKDERGNTVLELYFYWGNAEYYMGDTEDGRAQNAQNFEWIDYKYENAEGKIGASGFKAEKALKKYGIQLLEWKIAKPITNTFK